VHCRNRRSSSDKLCEHDFETVQCTPTLLCTIQYAANVTFETSHVQFSEMLYTSGWKVLDTD
jgi:hypothetical protein